MKKISAKSKFTAFGVSALLLCSFGMGGVAYEASAEMLEEPEYGNYFVSDYGSIEEAFEAGIELNREILGEGITMLKNEDNALPLKAGAKVTVLGKSSVAMSEFGGGAPNMQGIGEPIQLAEALEGEGFEVNPKFVEFYRDDQKSGTGRGNEINGNNFPGNGNIVSGYNTGETPVNSITEDLTESTEEYGDAAIVVFRRTGGEGTDLPRTMTWDGSSYKNWSTAQKVPGARNEDDHYLQLDQNETDLLKYANDHFEKVIVLLNMGTTFECGFLDDPGHYAYQPNVKAALNIGYTGKNATPSIAKILKGEINPSGRTVDTWARDFKLDTTWDNFGNGRVQDGNRYSDYSANYVIYQEGIYSGYRYWESRGFDEGLNTAYTSSGTKDSRNPDNIHGTTTTSWTDWYEAHVVYPLGYGLSYTTFTKKIVETTPENGANLTKDGKVTVKVEVENTGSVAGKEVVELYYTPPFEKNGIEKAQVNLCAFAKTGILEPGAKETVTLEFDVRDMASYDWSDANENSNKGYELEAGDYDVRLMENAHTEIGKVTYHVAEEAGFLYGTDEATEHEIANRFDEVSTYVTDTLNEQYLSRSDWEGTFPKPHIKIASSAEVKAGLQKWDGSNRPADETGEPWYVPEEEMPTQGAYDESELTLFDMIGLEYDDPQWEAFLNRFTVQQLRQLCLDGGYWSGQNWEDLGVTRVHNNDDPNGIHEGESLNGWKGYYIPFVNEAILSSSWNIELSFAKGQNIGNQAIWGVGRGNIPGWYAPATDTHRSQFGGRNFEYYSEDGFLAGMMAASQVRGAQDKGMFCYVKHFALNDQETNRTGLCTWANEQSMREIYFKSFEICVKYGDAHGTMSALNRIGTTWAGGDYRLLTQILKQEWGFHGCIVTDSYMPHMGGADLMLRAGGSLALGGAELTYNADSATVVAALREGAHDLLYAHANSMAMNRGDRPIAPDYIKTFPAGALEPAVVGEQYSTSIASATIDKDNYPDLSESVIKYSVAKDSALPEGLTLSEDGTLSGVPEEAVVNYRFRVNATYLTTTKTAEFTISIVASTGAILYDTEENLGSVRINTAANLDVGGAQVIGSETEISYKLKSGSLLPDGLTLSSAGKITGTPTKECNNYKFTVVATAENCDPAERTFKLSVTLGKLAFTGKTLDNAKIGVSYVAKLEAQADNAVTFALKEGSALPEGLELTAGGYIIGTPEETVKDASFTVVASAPFEEDVEATFKLSIGIAFGEIELDDAAKGEEYIGYVSFVEGADDLTYTVKAGSSLPKGLTLSEDGTLSGTPTRAGTYTFTVVASGEGVVGDEVEITLFVAGSNGGNVLPIALGVGIPVVLLAVIAAVIVVRRKRKQ